MSGEKTMNILQNAVDSIALGVEDYSSSDPRRLISCTRNIFAGILLLFKHKLSQLSPPGSDEVLIKQQILPTLDSATGLRWQGKGRKTVDVQQIKERFKSLDVVVDWKRVDRINDYRNDIEHYFSSLSHDAVRVLITDSFVVIRDFIRNQLSQDPLSLLGASTWGILTNVAEVYEKEKRECKEHIEAVDWKYDCLERAFIEYQCPECGSGLIDVTANGTDRDTADFVCRSCGEQWFFEGLAPLALSDYFAEANYRSIKDGGDPVTITCPECHEDTYILDDNVCVLCEESVERECKMCSMTIPPEEIDGEGYCSWCTNITVVSLIYS
jgi:hypothetical protein